MAERKRKAGVLTLKSAKELTRKLMITDVRGALYSLFHYTNADALAKMVSGNSIRLSRMDQMNDGMETFEGADRTYAFCLSAVPTENVGMWIAYGLPRRDAIRVRFSGKTILDICKTNKGRVGVLPVKGDVVQTQPVQGTVSLQYVGYVSRSGARVHVRKVIYQFPLGKSPKRQELMNECGSYIKLAGWQYEQEIRLVIRLDKAIDAERIQMDFSEQIGKMLKYQPKLRQGSLGMPSVIVGPWGNHGNFMSKFKENVKDLNREDVKYFVDHASGEKGLVRESEFKDKICLGRCRGCKQKRPCSCAYCEES